MKPTKNKRIRITRLIAILLTLITLQYTAMFYFENQLIYMGTKHSDSQRNGVLQSIPKLNFERKFFTHNYMNTEYFEKTANSNEYVLFLGGNAEDVTFDLQFLATTFKHQNIYTINYPGYGESQGFPDEERISNLLREFITSMKLDGKKLIVVGRSLGTGFATKIASEFKNVESLILVTPYYSMENLAIGHYPFMPKFLTNIFMKNKLETFKYAEKLNIPVLVIYAKNDAVVFNGHTEELISVIHKKEVVLIENETHDSVLMAPKTINSIQNFLK
jgi:pimeloyl-ACP methyl ester carboxylesterase